MEHLSRILIRAIIAAIILLVGLSIPLPFTPAKYFLTVQIPFVAFLFVAYLGKLLYDTFFYDRYHP